MLKIYIVKYKTKPSLISRNTKYHWLFKCVNTDLKCYAPSITEVIHAGARFDSSKE